MPDAGSRCEAETLQKRAPRARRCRPAIGGIRLPERARAGGERGGAILPSFRGRHVAPDPKSRYKFGACFWIPGSLVLLAPRNDEESEASHAPARELCPARRDPGGAAAIW